MIVDLCSLLSPSHWFVALSLRKVVTWKKVTAKQNSIFYGTRFVTTVNLLLVSVTENWVCSWNWFMELKFTNSTVSASHSSVKAWQRIHRQSSIQCIEKLYRFYPSSGKGEANLSFAGFKRQLMHTIIRL